MNALKKEILAKGSPEYLRNRIQRFQMANLDRCAHFFEQHPHLWRVVELSFFLACAVLIYFFLDLQAYFLKFDWFYAGMAQKVPQVGMLPIAAYIVLISPLLHRWMRPGHLPFYLVTIGGLVLLSLFHLIPIDHRTLLFILAINGIAVAFGIKLLSKAATLPRTLATYIIFFIAMFIIGSVGNLGEDSSEIFFLQAPRTLMLVFCFVSLNVVHGKTVAIPYLLNPSHLLTPIPFSSKPARDPRPIRSQIWALFGYTEALLCLAATAVLKFFIRKLYLFPLGSDFINVLLSGLLNYLLIYYVSVVWMAVPIATWRWLGYLSKAPFDLPLIASNPWDRWRRWNTHYFQWLYQFVFFPAFRATQSQTASIYLVFLVTIFIHIGRVTSPFSEGELFSGIFFTLRFFFWHASVIVLSAKAKGLFGSPNSLGGWRGVFFTWVLMILIHSQVGIFSHIFDFLTFRK